MQIKTSVCAVEAVEVQTHPNPEACGHKLHIRTDLGVSFCVPDNTKTRKTYRVGRTLTINIKATQE